MTALIAVVASVVVVPGTSASAGSDHPHKITTEFVCARHPVRGDATCLAERRTDIPVRKRGEVTVNAAPSGYAPVDLQAAYHIPASPVSSTPPTVALVDAYDDPAAESDLAVYRSQYGLSPCTTANGCFRKVSQTGSSSLPRANSGWASEIALDLEMVSAACPVCKILLVEATSAGITNLGVAARYAAGQVGTGGAVSNSYGAAEYNTDPSTGASYYNHPGVAIVASSGDEGYQTEFPAAYPNVIAVGGTSLSRATTARGWTESVWATSDSEGTGSGCSSYESKPSWQHDTGCTRRTETDVAAVADPATGVAVYDSYGSGGWTVFGGTSVASPLIATLYAMSGLTNPSAQTLYTGAGGPGLNDVTTGANYSRCGGSYLCQAGPGYDGPTGNGTPWGLAAFGGPAATSTTGPFSISAAPSAVTVPAGQTSSTITISTTTTSGSTPQTLTLSTGGAPTGVTAQLAATSLTSGSTTTLTLAVAAGAQGGSYPITVTATGADGTTTASTVVTLTVPGACPPAQQLANPGFESGNTGWSSTANVIGRWTGAEAPHSGSWDAWLDGYASQHTDTLAQTVAVPAGCTKVTVSYWLHILTNQTTTTTKYDTLTLTLGSATAAVYSNLDHNTGWVQYTVTLNLTPGQSSLPLTFTGVQSTSTNTTFLVDDTGLTFS